MPRMGIIETSKKEQGLYLKRSHCMKKKECAWDQLLAERQDKDKKIAVGQRRILGTRVSFYRREFNNQQNTRRMMPTLGC